jgi:glyoxylase-like metal-dependent hydrolase (beta-lactamase superfamily II)
MTALAAGMDYIDLNFLGRTGIIATAVLQNAGGVALIDPGPSTTLRILERSLSDKGIAFRDVRQILLTHVHLDHAGAVGTILKAHPHIQVHVHDIGAPHLADPSKLLASATRLYAEDMQRLWGEVLPVPQASLRLLSGGERLSAGGRELDVAYTPGHASHHVSYFDRSSGVAFVGDVAGIRRGTRGVILPPTPPPDIDLEAWRTSADRILEWDPDTLFLTHFGPFVGARAHFQELFERLAEWSRTAQRLLGDPKLTDDDRQTLFVEEVTRELRRAVGEQEAEQYARAGRLDFSWQGLMRYWRRKLKSEAVGRGTAVD